MLVEAVELGTETKMVVDSLDIAETFNKRHEEVVQAIQEVNCSKGFRRENYIPTIEWMGEDGKKHSGFAVTRDGFALLLGYLGDVPTHIVEAYLERFEQIEMAGWRKRLEREKSNAVQQALGEILQPRRSYVENPFGNWPIEQ